jgi:hypothetical protein
MKFFGRARPVSRVWIVLDEGEDAPEPVLGVFGSRGQAKQFFDSLDSAEYEDAALGEYDLDWTFRDGSQRYSS